MYQTTSEWAKKAMRELVERQKGANSDPETQHSRGDEILLTLLRSHGETEVADMFESLDRWYA